MLHLSLKKNKKYGNSFKKLGFKKTKREEKSFVFDENSKNYLNCKSLLKETKIGSKLKNLDLKHEETLVKTIQEFLEFSPLNSTQYISKEHYNIREENIKLKQKTETLSLNSNNEDDDYLVPVGGTMKGINTLYDIDLINLEKISNFDETEITSFSD